MKDFQYRRFPCTTHFDVLIESWVMQILDEKLFPSYQKGRQEGIESGVEKGKKYAALRQLQRGKLTDAEIAEDFDLSTEELNELKKQVDKK